MRATQAIFEIWSTVEPGDRTRWRREWVWVRNFSNRLLIYFLFSCLDYTPNGTSPRRIETKRKAGISAGLSR